MLVIAHAKTKAEKGLHLRQMARDRLHGAASLAKKQDCLVDAHLLACEAEDAHRQADELLAPSEPPQRGTGGEVRLTREEAFEHPGLAETLSDPDGVKYRGSAPAQAIISSACLTAGANSAQN